MLILYTQSQCRYSGRVLDVIQKLELEVDMRDISNPLLEKELIETGGSAQTPYLVDTDKVIEMYEADDIVDYLEEEYGKGL